MGIQKKSSTFRKELKKSWLPKQDASFLYQKISIILPKTAS